MNRRDFLKLTLYSTAATGLSSPLSSALAGHGGSTHRTLINIMCLGGADFRYLFAPNPLDTAYAAKYWDARQAIYNVAGPTYADYQAAWNALYANTTGTGAPVNGFGIHTAAGWLKTQFDANNVAIVCNVVGSSNRQHDHSQLIINTGDLGASMFVPERDGWGGRLAEAIGSANVVSMTNDISAFAKGSDSTNRNAQVIHAKDTRNFALAVGAPGSTQEKMGRALKNYYLSMRTEVASKPADWPFRKFIQHEKTMRDFGDPFKALTDANPLPASLTTGLTLNQGGFKKQISNIYDSFTGADLFNLRVASAEYGGWDTHSLQKTDFEENISDLFGTAKGLDALTSALPTAVVNDTVFVFTTDFGRQLRANGDAGTDHGSGNYMILVGPSVNGGVYGSMFPASEIIGTPAPYDIRGADIAGLTSFERILGEACDWVEPGTGVQVFPNTAKNGLPGEPIIEPGVDLTTLFA